MFDIGFQELVIIFIVALLVFGPKRLPEISKTLGQWVVEIRRGIHNAKVQMETEFEELEKQAGDAASSTNTIGEVDSPEDSTKLGDSDQRSNGTDARG